MTEIMAKARSTGRIMVSSVVELDSDIQGAQIKHSQVSVGSFQAQLQRVVLNHSALDFGLFNQQVYGAGQMPHGAYTFFYFPDNSDLGHLNDFPLVRGVWFYKPGEEIYGALPENFRWFSFSVEQSALEERMEAIGVDPARFKALNTGPLASRTDTIDLEYTLQHIYKDGCTPGKIGSAEILAEKVLFSLVDTIELNSAIHLAGHGQCSVTRNAIDILRACLQRPVSATELCQKLRCSRRQIEYGFKNTYQMGPIAFHRKLRLNAVHRCLLTSKPGEVSVTAAASKYGFTHLGRLSADYLSLFGEYPRQTLKRFDISPFM